MTQMRKVTELIPITEAENLTQSLNIAPGSERSACAKVFMEALEGHADTLTKSLVKSVL